MQVLGGLSSPGDQGGVAFWAHAGGFIAGAALIPFFKYANVPLWAGAQSKPFQVEKPKTLADVATPPRGPSGGWQGRARSPGEPPQPPRNRQPGGRGDPLDPNFAPREWQPPSAPSGGQRKPAERAPQPPRSNEPPRDPSKNTPPKGPWG
jgi:hypothetical protein